MKTRLGLILIIGKWFKQLAFIRYYYCLLISKSFYVLKCSYDSKICDILFPSQCNAFWPGIFCFADYFQWYTMFVTERFLTICRVKVPPIVYVACSWNNNTFQINKIYVPSIKSMFNSINWTINRLHEQ